MLITDSRELKRFSSCHRVWQGIPGIAVTPRGRTFVSFYSGGVKEDYGNYAVVIQSDDEIHFSEPIVAVEKKGKFRVFDPVLWLDPLSRLWLIWNVMPGEEVWGCICSDPDAPVLTWGEEFLIGRGIMMNKPLVLSTGEWLFPIALWKKEIYANLRADGLKKSDVAASYVYKTSDQGKTFCRLGGADLRDRSFDEHMVIEQENGVLRMLVRLKRGIGESFSYDRGKTWSQGQKSVLDGPSSRFFIGTLPSGRVLLVNHDNFTGRNNLTAFLSEDGGKTFPHKLLLDERRGVSYPDAVFCHDGYIRIVYDRMRGCFKSSLKEVYTFPREILMAKVREEDILAGSIVSPEGQLKRVVSRLGKLAKEDPDPFESLAKEDRAVAKRLVASGKKGLLSAVFEEYALHLNNVCNFAARDLDEQIERFETGGEKDEALLAEIIGLIRTTPKKNDDFSPVAEGVKAYLEAHANEEFSLSDLAESMGISMYYLSHLFRKYTGITILEYRNELRLTMAKSLLLNTKKSISEIAQETGFCSSAYFAKVFVRSEKVAPTVYRALHQK